MRDIKIKFVYLLIAILSGTLIAVSFSFGLFSGLENYFEDLLVFSKPINKDIVVVAIDNESIQKIGQWPWSREVFAKALSALKNDPPKSVGIDVIFSEPSRLGQEDDLVLKRELEQLSFPVILPVEAIGLSINNDLVSAGSFLKPLSIFEGGKNTSFGHVNLILDRDGVTRKIPLIIQPFNAFAYEVVKKSNEQFVADEFPKNITRIVYSAPTGSIRRVPFWRLLEKDVPNLKDKIILIGATAADLHDEKPTPFSLGTEMPGVEIQANIVNMFLSDYHLAPLERGLMLAWIFFAAILAGIFFIIFSSSFAAFFINILVGILYIVVITILFENGFVANLIHINLSWILSAASLFGYKYFSVEKERREIKHIFSKYVSKDVLDNILHDPTKVKLGGEEKEVTVLFSDIRGFTTFAERTKPKELVAILNKYFSLMSDQVLKNGGVLDKYIGDAIMAFWGAPLDDPNNADNALRAALGMVVELEKFNKELKQRGDSEIYIGIGLYTGPVIAGNIGSEFRFDYTVIGDTVNIASRLEGLNKEYKTSIIIGETTKNKLKSNYRFKFLGSATVKGRARALDIYAVEE